MKYQSPKKNRSQSGEQQEHPFLKIYLRQIYLFKTANCKQERKALHFVSSTWRNIHQSHRAIALRIDDISVFFSIYCLFLHSKQ